MNKNYENEKMKAEQKLIDALRNEDVAPSPFNLESMHETPAGYAGQAQAMGINPNYRRPTLREEAEKSAAYHDEQRNKHTAAAAFLREYPQFDEFIRLIRSGAIQF